MRLDGKVVLIAGAGDNMGRAIPVVCAQEGARLVLVSRNREALAETERLARETGGACVSLEADLRDPQTGHRAVELAVRQFGGLDAVVNVAGGFSDARIATDESLGEAWFAAALTNLVTTMAYVCDAALPSLRARGGGAVLNISAAPWTRLNANPAYGAAKEGVLGFTRSLARRLWADDIRVNTLSPGRVHSPLPPLPYTARVLRQTGGSPGDGQPAGLGRFGSGVDVAWATVYLISDESAWVTGAELIVDGGDAILAQGPVRPEPR